VTVQNPREIAARILRLRRTSGEYTENLLETALAGAQLSAADRGLCQEIVYGAVRWQNTLDWLIARKTRGRTQKPGLQDLLRLGLYQIFWLDRIPDHAAVNETVEMAKRDGYGPQAGFVNAVLRGYLREADATKNLLAELKTTQPALGYSHPEWLVSRWHKRWGDERLRQLLEWNNTPPKIFARVNTLKTEAGKLLTQWRDEDVEYDFFRRDWCEENLFFELKSHPPLAVLPSFRQGLFYVQDPGTLLAVRELDPRSGERILDLCAAPGGKTTFIAQLMQNEGRIIAADVSSERLKFVEENCARLGVACVEPVVSASPSPSLPGPLPLGGGEGESLTAGRRSGRGQNTREAVVAVPLSPRMGEGSGVRVFKDRQVDRVLVDAPCSNTGVMRRRVDLRWRIRPEEIERLRATQLALLRQAAVRLKPGGILVYSTCSLEPEENNEVVQQFLSGHTGFKLERERELLPFTDGVDGAFVVRIRRI
jgi:16S rRNA (cytosine967-C5)-methyltransferase